MNKTLVILIAAASFGLGANAALAQVTAPADAAGAYPAPAVTKPPVDTPQRVLFVGNSLMYYSGGLQTHTHRMAFAQDPKLESIRAGFKSVHITSAPVDQYPIDHMLTPGNLGIKEPFQVVLLAGSSRDATRPEGVAVYRQKVREFDAAAKKVGAKLALIWLQTMVVKPGGWDEAMYKANGEMVMAAANEVGAYVIPLGPAFKEAYRQRPDIQLQMDYDGYHATVAGQYLSSAIVFEALYGRSIVGNSYTYFGALDKDTAAFLQKVAHETVEKFYAQKTAQK